MSLPVRPSEIKLTVPSPTGNFCEKFVSVFALPALVHRLYSWLVNEDLTLTADAKALICGVVCDCANTPGGGGGTPPGTTPPVGAVPKPTNVSATDGTSSSQVIVTWGGSIGATSYEIWRGDNPTLAAAIKVGTSAGLSYNDTSVMVGSVYFYWLRAVRAGSFSEFSDPDSGFAAPPQINGNQPFFVPGIYSFPVPPTVILMNFDGLGAGAGGGGAAGSRAAGGASWANAGGGGGGGGGRSYVTGFTVIPNEILLVYVGDGGLGGAQAVAFNSASAGAQPGQPGGISRIVRVSDGTTLAAAPGGNPGYGGLAAWVGEGSQGGPGGTGGVGSSGDGQPGSDGIAQVAGVGQGGSGGAGNQGSVGAGGNGGSTANGVFYSAGKGRPGAVVLTW